jgi:hypothetical protein
MREPFPNPTAWTPDFDALEVQAVFRVGKPPVHAMTSGKRTVLGQHQTTARPARRGRRADNLTKVGNTLTQRVLRTAGGATVTVRLELAGLADGQHAGLCHYAAAYAGLGVLRSGTTTTIAHNADGTLTYGPAITQKTVWLRTTWDANGVSRFSYSLDGNVFSSFGGTYQLAWGGYRGDRVSLYTYNPNGTGYVDSVQYTIAPTRVHPVRQRAQRQGRRRLPCVERGRLRRHPVARHRRVEPAVGLPVHGGRLPHHRLCPQRQGARRGGVLTADGAAIAQMTAVGRTSQQWQPRPQTGGEFVLVNRNSVKVLDVKGGSTADGVTLIQYRDVGSCDQRWTFHRVTGQGP